MIVSNSASIEVKFDTTVGDLIALLSTFPKDAKVEPYATQYYNQFDSGTKGIKVTWTERT